MNSGTTQEPFPTEKGRARRGGRLVRAARALVLGLGWLAFVGGLTLAWLDWSGWLGHIVVREVARRLDLPADELSIEDTDLRLRRRSLVLQGVTLGRAKGVALRELELRLGWSSTGGIVLEQVLVDGGSLRLSRELTSALSGGDAAPTELGARLPTVVVRAFEVSAESPEGDDLELGRIDAVLTQKGGGAPRLTGRWLAPASGAARRASIYLDGELSDGDVLEVRGAAREFAFDAGSLPPGTPLDAVRSLDPRGVCALEANARYVLGESVLPDVSVSLRLSDGSLHLPHLDANAPRIEGVAIDLAAQFAPGAGSDLWDREAWSATLRATAAWEGSPAEAHVRIGREASTGALLDGWVHVPRLRFDNRLLELAGDVDWAHELWAMLEPRGSGELAVGLRLPGDWRAGEDLDAALEQSIVVSFDGAASCQYFGGRNLRAGGRRNLGFPLRVEELVGRVGYRWRPREALPEELGLFALEGRAGEGRVRVTGTSFNRPRRMDPPPGEEESPRSLMHILVSAEELSVDGHLRAAFAGLEGVEGIAELYPEYAPHGGELDFALDLWRRPDRPQLATRLAIALSEVGFEFAPFPLPVRLNGSLTLAAEGREEEGRLALAIDARGETDAARGEVRLAGRLEAGPDAVQTSWFQVRARGLDLTAPGLQRALEVDVERPSPLLGLGATGHVDVAASFERALPLAPSWTGVEIEASSSGVALVPDAFPAATGDVRGRVLSTALAATAAMAAPGVDAEVPESEVRAALSGRWDSGGRRVPIAVSLATVDGETRVRALGAGIDVTDAALQEVVSAALGDGGGDVGLDPSRVDLEGHVDFETTFALERAPEEEPQDLALVLHARLRRLGLGSVHLLRDLEGRLTYAGGVWASEALRGELGSTPVELSDFRYETTEKGARIALRLSAKDLPIDEEHLRYFLDESTLRTLLDDLRARGRFDVNAGLLTLETGQGGEAALAFEGALALHDMFVDLGLPVSIRSAEEVLLHLYYEADRVRARARVRELYGRVAGRRLDGAAMQVSYVDPLLTIEGFAGKLEGGELRSLGHGAATGSHFFSIDLEPPFTFALSADLAGVDIGGLLAGLFNSNFANEGTLEGRIRLRGDIDDLVGARGAGSIQVEDSSLWAIPVFQALFSQLGFDTTALFKTMSTDFTIEGGRIDMRRMRVESDLLSLVGEGSITLDGRLNHDLEVRYSILDKLGPLTRLFYKIQNSLLRVSIRGDMSRPEVVLRGFFSQFLQRPGEDVHRLPLPALSSLPQRF